MANNRLFQIQQDLRAVRQDCNGKSKPGKTDSHAVHYKAVHQSLSYHTTGYSEPFYATGEHVLAGEVSHSLFDHTRNLNVNGVGFTYAEIMAMGDLFGSYADMIKASTGELLRLQALIQKSRNYYEDMVNKVSSPGASNPSDADWQAATQKRYAKLAEENFAHFAPSSSVILPGFSNVKKNNKTEWEKYHRLAIESARKGTTSDSIYDALVINAFGDHFLTDAFSAGHLFNKEDVNQLFISKAMNGKSLNSAASKFLENVANETFTNDVKREFSKYEITSRDFDKGFILWNIDTTNAFRKLLVQIMEKEPDLFGKTVVAGAIHDKLNDILRAGKMPVRNNMGDRWDITGDSGLNQVNLTIMKKAVSQSISNVYDSVSNATTPIGTFFKKVWDYIPQPEPGAVVEIKKFIELYTDPSHHGLLLAAKKMIQKNYIEILDELVKRRHLKKA